MKVHVDATKCSAYGVCSEMCPSVFQLDEWGYAQPVGDGTVPPEHEQSARKAVAACPEHAISAED
jgi:ferredoxin